MQAEPDVRERTIYNVYGIYKCSGRANSVIASPLPFLSLVIAGVLSVGDVVLVREMKEAVRVLGSQALWAIEIFSLSLGYGSPVLVASLLPHLFPLLCRLEQRVPHRLSPLGSVEQSHLRIAAGIMSVLHALAGAPVLGSLFALPGFDGLLAIEVVTVVHLRTTVVLRLHVVARVPLLRQLVSDVGVIPRYGLHLILLDLEDSAVGDEECQVASHHLGGRGLLDALSGVPSASFLGSDARRHELPRSVPTHVGPLRCPTVSVRVVLTEPAVGLVAVDGRHLDLFSVCDGGLPACDLGRR